MRGPTRFWEHETLKNIIMKACIILHNRIVKDERDINVIYFNYDATEESPLSVSQERTTKLFEFIQTHHPIRDQTTHSKFLADLVEHLWQLHRA